MKKDKKLSKGRNRDEEFYDDDLDEEYDEYDEYDDADDDYPDDEEYDDYDDDQDDYADEDDDYADEDDYEDEDDYGYDDEYDYEDDDFYDDVEDEKGKKPFSLLEKILLFFIVVGVIGAIVAGVLIWQFSVKRDGTGNKTNRQTTETTLPGTTEATSAVLTEATSEEETEEESEEETVKAEKEVKVRRTTKAEEEESESETEETTEARTTAPRTTEARTTAAPTTAAHTTAAPTTAAVTTAAPTVHQHSWVETSRTEANCVTAGAVNYRCNACGETRSETIPATGNHNWGAPYRQEKLNYYRCSVCGAERTEPNPYWQDPTTQAPTQHVHNWKETNRTPAGCETPGVITYRCEADGVTRTEEIPASGHQWVETGRSETINYTCSVCQVTRSEPNPDWVAPTTQHEHTWVEVARTPATCVAPGSIQYQCAANDGATREEAIPAAGHQWNETGNVCSVCGAPNPDYVAPETPAPSASDPAPEAPANSQPAENSQPDAGAEENKVEINDEQA